MKPFLFNMLGSSDKQSSCRGKRRYSQKSAERAALTLAQKHHEPFQAYKCQHCDSWHVGHPLFWRWSADKKRKNGVV
jgi:hypothetical protein